MRFRPQHRQKLRRDACFIEPERPGATGADHIRQSPDVAQNIATENKLSERQIRAQRKNQSSADSRHDHQNQFALDGQVSILACDFHPGSPIAPDQDSGTDRYFLPARRTDSAD